MPYVIVGPYRRYGLYSPKEVLNFIGLHVKEYDGHKVKMSSMRYRTFKKSIVCATCGIIGVHFALETHNHSQSLNRPHFNLYAINAVGEEVLMTKDHIIPKAKGGSNNLNNLQTMCTICNCEKDDKIVEVASCQ
jgi:hypothetical protein